MQLGFEIKNKNLIATIDGEIDHHTCIELRNKTDRIIESSPIQNLIFNFSNVTFMDSSGIGVIMGRYKNINTFGGRVFITNISPQIKKILEMSGLLKIVHSYESVDEAIKEIDGEEK